MRPLLFLASGLVLLACGADDPAVAPVSTTNPAEPQPSSAVDVGNPVAAECFDEVTIAESAAPVGITDDGRVVGNIIPARPGDATHAFVWRDGTLTNLPSLGGDSTYALGMNARGDVVGVATKAGETSPGHAVLWPHDGTKPVELGDFGSGWSTAKHVNAAGDVAGISSTPDNAYHAFLWKAGNMQRIDLGASDGLNERDQVLAHGQNGAFLWDNGVLTSLGTAYFTGIARTGRVLLANDGGASFWNDGTLTDFEPYADETDVTPSALTPDGVVLGTATWATGEVAGFLWQNGLTKTLGVAFRPNAVNAHTEVAGSVGLQAAVWKAGKTIMLSAATPNGAYATGINDHGQVVGNVDVTVKRWSTTGCF